MDGCFYRKSNDRLNVVGPSKERSFASQRKTCGHRCSSQQPRCRSAVQQFDSAVTVAKEGLHILNFAKQPEMEKVWGPHVVDQSE